MEIEHTVSHRKVLHIIGFVANDAFVIDNGIIAISGRSIDFHVVSVRIKDFVDLFIEFYGLEQEFAVNADHSVKRCSFGILRDDPGIAIGGKTGAAEPVGVQIFIDLQVNAFLLFDDLSIDDKSEGVSSSLIKRVIATEGQHVKITTDAIYVDDVKLEEDYAYFDAQNSDFYEPMELTVPEGKVFVLGDHRKNSWDSRRFECVDERAIVGRALVRLSPFTIYLRNGK